MTERELFEHFNKDVYRTCFYMLRHASDAEDVCQEVFIKAFASNWREIQYLKTWLLRIATHECLNHMKKHRTRAWREGMLQRWSLAGEREEAAVDQMVERAEQSAEWRQRIDKLPVKIRMVVILRHMNECSYAEIAEVLQIPEGTVKSRLHKGLSRLKQSYEREFQIRKDGAVYGQNGETDFRMANNS